MRHATTPFLFKKMFSSPLLAFVISLSVSASLFASSEQPPLMLATGSLSFDESQLAPNDYVHVTYADSLLALMAAQPTTTKIEEPGQGLSSCLSVAQVRLESGQQRLPTSGKLRFGCTDVPETALVMGYIDGGWEPVASRRLSGGRLEIDLDYLTTYTIVVPPAAQDAGQI